MAYHYYDYLKCRPIKEVGAVTVHSVGFGRSFRNHAFGFSLELVEISR